MHMTIYHARRPMPNLEEASKSCLLTIDTNDLKFMVIAPGGENPRLELIPGERKVGVRITRTSIFREKIYKYRNMLIEHETSQVLGLRKRSTKSKNTFGARHFQPHISLLNSGSFIKKDLTILGNAFRDSITEITFDRFVIQKKKNF